MMKDSKTKQQTLVTRKTYLECKREILNAMDDIDYARRKIKICRPVLVAYSLKDEIDYSKFKNYDEWLVDDFLGGEDYEDAYYSVCADMIINGLAKERETNN